MRVIENWIQKKKLQVFEISTHTNHLSLGLIQTVTTTGPVMANIQIGFSEIQDSDVTVWELFGEITNRTCQFYGHIKYRSLVEELLENYTFRSSGQLSDKNVIENRQCNVNFEWCKDNGRRMCYCNLYSPCYQNFGVSWKRVCHLKFCIYFKTDASSWTSILQFGWLVSLSPKPLWYAPWLPSSFSPSLDFKIALGQIVSLSVNQNSKTVVKFALSRPPHQNRQCRSNLVIFTSSTPES
jgi:hypothetical protein